MDLSSSAGHSINNGISKELCSFHYTPVSEATAQVCKKGPSALLAKMDIKQVYQNIPIAQEDRHLLGFEWNDIVYIEQVLPFGLRSAPLIFSAVADALLAIMLHKGVSWAIH